MTEEKDRASVQQSRAEKFLRQEFEQTLGERVDRFLKVRPHDVVPYTHFSAALAECTFLYINGYFYGCIALVQAVTEALVRFLCHRNSFKPKKDFEKNVEKLFTRNLISIELKQIFLKIWEERDDYHHLNPNIETDRKALEELAKEKVLFLIEAEKQIFQYEVVDGEIVPKYPKYWETKGDIFLKCVP